MAGRDESGKVQWSKVHLRPVEFLSGYSAPSGRLSSWWYNIVILTPATLTSSPAIAMVLQLCFDSGPIGHMAGLPQYRNSLSHLPWVMFIFSSQASDFSSMWLLIGLIFRPTVSVRKKDG